MTHFEISISMGVNQLKLCMILEKMMMIKNIDRILRQ